MPTDTAGDLHDSYADRLFDVSTSPHVLTLAERFTLPPFSVLDARGEWWQSRKRLWKTQGLKSEVGRSARTFVGRGERTDGFAKALEKKAGNGKGRNGKKAKPTKLDEVSEKILALSNGQSIFDPVLCELAYRWFCPTGGHVLDPFAGGSVRGIVASVLGRWYTGIDLSGDQLEANREQSLEFEQRNMYRTDCRPEWEHGDSLERLPHVPTPDGKEGYDFVWSCPPYFDLEVYSDDPRDLSNMSWPEFLASYEEIIRLAVERLAPNRFCGFVVGEIRDKDGYYRNLVGETIRCFQDAGAEYYNELFIVNPAGTLPLRTAKQFDVSRKIGKTHQNILIFVKGDPKAAAAACDPGVTSFALYGSEWDTPEED